MAIELTDDQGNQYLIPETVDQGVIPSMINEQMQGLGATPPQQGGFMNALATALASPQFRQLIEPSMTPATTLPDIPSSHVVGLPRQAVSEVHQMVQQDRQFTLQEKLRQRMELQRQMEAEKERQQQLKLEMMRIRNDEMVEEIRARKAIEQERARQAGMLARTEMQEMAKTQREQAKAASRVYTLRPGTTLGNVDQETGEFREIASMPAPPKGGGGGRGGSGGARGASVPTGTERWWIMPDGREVHGVGYKDEFGQFNVWPTRPKEEPKEQEKQVYVSSFVRQKGELEVAIKNVDAAIAEVEAQGLLSPVAKAARILALEQERAAAEAELEAIKADATAAGIDPRWVEQPAAPPPPGWKPRTKVTGSDWEMPAAQPEQTPAFLDPWRSSGRLSDVKPLPKQKQYGWATLKDGRRVYGYNDESGNFVQVR